MELRFCAVFVAVTGLAVLAACSSGGGSKTSGSGSHVACPDIIPAPPTMISPADGATGVADGNFSLVLTSSALNTFQLTAPGAATVTLPSPSPVPVASPSPSTDFAYAVPALQAATTYTLVGTFSEGPGCPTLTDSIGTFTTQ